MTTLITRDELKAAIDSGEVTVVDALPRQIGDVAVRRRIGVEVAVRRGLVDAPVAVGGVEPDLVLHDRAAEIGVALPEEQIRVVALQRARAVRGTDEASSGDVRRVAVAADK